ncbi:hypothetical protein C0991_000411 [Blastosporella zonata]|nr:hypothetical protein C0991_000411 [Blastosporella zonata]
MIISITSQVDNPQLKLTEESKTTNRFRSYLELAAPAMSTTHAYNELEHYLSTPTENLHYKVNGKIKIESPLRWWIKHRDTYPRLSRMALDYLSIPATAVDVERVFSAGRQVLSYL